MASSGDHPVGTPGSRPAGVRLGEGILHVLRSATHAPPPPAHEPPEDEGVVTPAILPATDYTEAHAERDAKSAVRYLVGAVVVSTLATCLGLFASSGKGGLLWVAGLVVTVVLGWRGVQTAMRAQRLAYAVPVDLMVKSLTLLGLAVLMMVPYVLSVLN
jgi:hypothetical protein